MHAAREYASDEAKLKVYGHRLKQGESRLDDWKPLAEAWIRRYENVPNSNQVSGNGHVVSVPTGTSIIDSLYSSLTAADVNAMVHASGAGTRDQEDLASEALGKEWELTKTSPRAARAIKDSLLVGLGWVKVGYEYDSTVAEVPRPDADIAEDVQALIEEAQAAGHDIDAATIANYVPISQEQEQVIVDRVVVDYVPWNRVVFDTSAKGPDEIRWIAQLSQMHPDEVKENPTFVEYCKRTRTTKKLKELGTDSFIEVGTVNVDKDEDARLTVVEMYDFETGTVCTFARGADFLLNEAPNVFALNLDLEDKSPFVPCVLRQSPGRVRGISEMELLTPTLEEMDLYHSRLATYLERFVPKVLMPKGMLTEAGKEGLESQEYGAVVELETGFDATQTQTLNPPVLPAEVFGVSDKLENSARDASGVNELMRGLFPDRKRTATETSEVVQSSAARQAEKRVQLERFYEAIAKRILQLMQMMYSAERMVRYNDGQGPIEWSWTAEDIVFETKLEIVLTPKEVRNWQTRRDDALAMLNVLGPMAQPGPDGSSVVDQAELLKYVLEEFGVSDATVATLLNLPEEQQAQQLAAQQAAAGQAGAEQGVPRPDMTSGPLSPEQVAAATNSGALPPELLAQAYGNTPVTPQATEQLSESAGVAHPA